MKVLHGGLERENHPVTNRNLELAGGGPDFRFAGVDLDVGVTARVHGLEDGAGDHFRPAGVGFVGDHRVGGLCDHLFLDGRLARAADDDTEHQRCNDRKSSFDFH